LITVVHSELREAAEAVRVLIDVVLVHALDARVIEIHQAVVDLLEPLRRQAAVLGMRLDVSLIDAVIWMLPRCLRQAVGFGQARNTHGLSPLEIVGFGGSPAWMREQDQDDAPSPAPLSPNSAALRRLPA
jgi:hypothetical protein